MSIDGNAISENSYWVLLSKYQIIIVTNSIGIVGEQKGLIIYFTL